MGRRVVAKTGQNRVGPLSNVHSPAHLDSAGKASRWEGDSAARHLQDRCAGPRSSAAYASAIWASLPAAIASRLLRQPGIDGAIDSLG
jgi:hypothetical protein